MYYIRTVDSDSGEKIYSDCQLSFYEVISNTNIITTVYPESNVTITNYSATNRQYYILSEVTFPDYGYCDIEIIGRNINDKETVLTQFNCFVVKDFQEFGDVGITLNKIKKTDDGSIIVCGTVNNSYYGNYNSDGMLMKLDSDLNISWFEHLGEYFYNANDYLNDFIINDSGNIIFTGGAFGNGLVDVWLGEATSEGVVTEEQYDNNYQNEGGMFVSQINNGDCIVIEKAVSGDYIPVIEFDSDRNLILRTNITISGSPTGYWEVTDAFYDNNDEIYFSWYIVDSLNFEYRLFISSIDTNGDVVN